MTTTYRVCAYAGTEFLWELDFENEVDSRDFMTAALKALGQYRFTWEIRQSQGKDKA